MRMKTLSRWLLGGGVAGGAAVAVERSPSAFDTASAPPGASHVIAAVRFSRAFCTASLVMADYRLLFARHGEYKSEEYKKARSTVHARSAERILKLCRTQGAVYVKIGQHVASMTHGVPQEYSSRLKTLEDRASHRPFHQVERLLEREIGNKLSQDFSSFDETPIAAASLAQVHRARLQNSGELVAVKIQYPGLETLVRSDLASIQALSWLLSWVFPFFSLDWIVQQFRRNLSKELDFALEAQSAIRTAAHFENDDRIQVPRVYENLTTKRILTMEYIDGFRVDDLEAMNAAGISPTMVAQAVVDAFAQMIFVNGFVHCDGHAGNLLVRQTGPRKVNSDLNKSINLISSVAEGAQQFLKPHGSSVNFQLYLLDHGLYRELDDNFRKSYCLLWRGLVLRNNTDVTKACEQLGAPGFADLFSIFLLNRSWSSARKLGTDLRNRMTPEEMDELRNNLRRTGLNFESNGGLESFFAGIPEDLLLVFKMNSLVRNVNKALGAQINRFKVNARYAVRGLHHANDNGTDINTRDILVIPSFARIIFSSILTLMDRFAIEINLLIIDVLRFALSWWSQTAPEIVRIG